MIGDLAVDFFPVNVLKYWPCTERVSKVVMQLAFRQVYVIQRKLELAKHVTLHVKGVFSSGAPYILPQCRNDFSLLSWLLTTMIVFFFQGQFQGLFAKWWYLPIMCATLFVGLEKIMRLWIMTSYYFYKMIRTFICIGIKKIKKIHSRERVDTLYPILCSGKLRSQLGYFYGRLIHYFLTWLFNDCHVKFYEGRHTVIYFVVLYPKCLYRNDKVVIMYK